MEKTLQMNILIIGSGGREHAIAAKIAESNRCQNLYVAPGNAGTAQVAVNIAVDISDFQAVKQHVLDREIDMVMVGPEAPLVQGIYDFFQADNELNHIKVLGPSQAGAMLEGSKDRAKEFMKTHQIPTAAYQTFTAQTVNQGKEFLETLKPPYVLKADGLAAGKGVLILSDLDEAKTELENMLVDSKFGAASEKVVVEEFLDGIELSVFVLSDGKNYKILPTAKDYKRIGDGDTGLNTGGMGAVSPVPFADAAFMKKVEERIAIPTVKGLAAENIAFQGFLFLGLMNVNGDPYMIEYNVRMGDPETEVVFPRIKSDVVELFEAACTGKLDTVTLDIDEKAAVTVMLVSGGYPEDYEKGKVIKGLEKITDSVVYHAGTRQEGNEIVTAGGRVMAVTSLADDFREAMKKSYQSIEYLSFDRMNYRTDIGKDLL